jgi:hypothetical protein
MKSCKMQWARHTRYAKFKLTLRISSEVMACWLVRGYHHFGKVYILHLDVQELQACPLRAIPKDINLWEHRCENLKSRSIQNVCRKPGRKKRSLKLKVKYMLKKQGVKLYVVFFVGFCELGNEPSGYIEGMNICDHQHDNSSWRRIWVFCVI